MDAELEPVYERVINATRPEEIFRELHMVLPPRLLDEHLEKEVTRYRQVLDVDKYTSVDDAEAVALARSKFEELYQAALTKAARGHFYADGFSHLPPPTEGRKIKIGDTEYSVGREIHLGEHTRSYESRFSLDRGSAGAIIKIANTSADNPFINNEIRILDRLHRKVDDKELGYWRYLPFVFGRFRAGTRNGFVARLFEGHTLETVRANALHRDGLDQRHMIWILDRTLNLLGYAHSQKIVHGRIEPNRLRIRASNHNVLVTGWSQAVYKPAITGERILSTGSLFEAPEIATTGHVGPWTDIYSLGKTMIWLVGGDPVTNQMPDSVEAKLQQFLRNMVRKNPRARPKDAWQLYKAHIALKDSLWERRFLHLEL